jgi:uncharacterized membrane protein
MEDVSIESAASYAWGRLKANPAFHIFGLLLAFLIASAVGSLVVGPVAMLSGALNFFFSKGFHWMELLVVALAFAVKCMVLAPLLVGYLKGIRKEAAGETAGIVDIFTGFSNYASTVVFSAVMGATLAVGFACFFVPGLLLCPVFSMGLYYLAEGVTGSYGVDAIVKAFKNWSFGLEVFIIVVLVGSLLAGLLLCCVGTLITVPLGVVACWSLCRQFDEARRAAKANADDEQIGTPS